MSRPGKRLAALGAAAATVLASAPLVALGETPIEAHLIPPEGAELVTHPRGPAHGDHGDFLDVIDGLDVHRQGGALGVVKRGRSGVMVTAVRLRDADQAAMALSAFGNGPPDDATFEVLPLVAPDTITHRITEARFGVETTLVEVARATGRDLVVFAQLDMTAPNVEAFTREVVETHLAAFPDITPPATVGPRVGALLLSAGSVAGVVVAALGLASLRRRRQRVQPVPSAPIDPGQVRVNW